MLNLVTPHMQLASVLDIDTNMLAALGIEGLALDLDETLKDYYSNEIRPEVTAWVERMKRDSIRLCMLTNGKSRRVRPFSARLGIPCVPVAMKPFPFGLRRAMATLQLDRTRVAMVGDQIFADVIAGRLAGVYTILVQRTTGREPWITHIKRPLERWVLRRIAARTR